LDTSLCSIERLNPSCVAGQYFEKLKGEAKGVGDEAKGRDEKRPEVETTVTRESDQYEDHEFDSIVYCQPSAEANDDLQCKAVAIVATSDALCCGTDRGGWIGHRRGSGRCTGASHDLFQDALKEEVLRKSVALGNVMVLEGR